jgi:hypothetical protein
MYPLSVVSLLALKWLREAFVHLAADISIVKDRMDSHTDAQACDAQVSSPQWILGTFGIDKNQKQVLHSPGRQYYLFYWR